MRVMNKRIILAIVFLLALVTRMSAEDKVTISDFVISAGETKELSITLDNEVTYAAFQFDLYLPEGLTVSEYSKDLARIPETTSLSMAKQKDGSFLFIAAAMKTKPIAGTSGGIVTIKVTASEDLASGSLTGYFRKVKLSDKEGTGKTYEEMSFPITVLEPSTVKAKSYTRTYGDDNPVFEYTVTGGALDGTPEITCEATKESSVGTYDIIVKRGTETNCNVTYVKGTLTIAPKTMSNPTITLSPASYIFDGSEKKPTVTVADGGTIIPSEEYAVSYSNNTNVGTATVTITDKAGGNYIVSGSATFAITAADGSLTPPTGKTGLTYTGAAQDLITAGSSTTGTLQYSLDGTIYGTTIPKGTDAKEYTIYYKVVASAGYKDVAPASFKVTIAKAPLKIKAGTYTRKQGEENPEFTLEYEGFKNDETEDVLTKKPTVTTTATKNSSAGDYSVTVSGAVATNYEITYVDGMLTVVKKKGDVNGDGDVDQKDIDAIVSYLYGDITDDFDEEAADVNGDKVVNVADIVEIVKMKK